MGKWNFMRFHPTLYWACDYLSMLGLKVNHVSKRGPLVYHMSWKPRGHWKSLERAIFGQVCTPNVSGWFVVSLISSIKCINGTEIKKIKTILFSSCFLWWQCFGVWVMELEILWINFYGILPWWPLLRLLNLYPIIYRSLLFTSKMGPWLQQFCPLSSETVIGWLNQYHGCGCPSSLWWQVISNNVINYAG